MESSSKKQIFITGGSRGIGRAVCELLAKKGYEIGFSFKSNEEGARDFAQQLSQEHKTRVEAFHMDVSNTTSIESSCKKILGVFENLSAIVNNAGISIEGLILRMNPETFDEILNTNLRGAFFVTKALLKPLLKARSGSIVFMSSVIGQSGNSGHSVYAASKAGVIAVAKSLAQELASRKIRVNAIAPGFIQTDMTQALPAQIKESILTKIPMGEFGSVEDIAHAVDFLISPKSQYITGQVLAVNGGMYM